jgi:flagellar biosynthesis/type III secretory pathway protein FliH
VIDDPTGFKLETYGAKPPESQAQVKQESKSTDVFGSEPHAIAPENQTASEKTDGRPTSEFLTGAAELESSTEANKSNRLARNEEIAESAKNSMVSMTGIENAGPDNVEAAHATINSDESNFKIDDLENSDIDSFNSVPFSTNSEGHLASENEDGLSIEDECPVLGNEPSEQPTVQSMAELSELRDELTQKNKQWDEERVQLLQKLEELQVSIDAKEKDYLENIELIEKSLNEKLNAQLEILKEVTNRVEEYTKTPDRIFEPMKRLSMHIAEQLVLAELNLSGSSIERLIQRCLDELSNRNEPSVIVELNSQDKARLEELSGDLTSHLQLRSVPGLQAGSVRVISDDTQVDDLITNRLEGLAHSLLGQPEIWKEKSPFFRQPLAQRESEVQDVRQRITASDNSFEENFND